MYSFNIIVSNIEKLTKLVHNLYKDSQDDILGNNVFNIVFKTIYIKPRLLK